MVPHACVTLQPQKPPPKNAPPNGDSTPVCLGVLFRFHPQLSDLTTSQPSAAEIQRINEAKAQQEQEAKKKIHKSPQNKVATLLKPQSQRSPRKRSLCPTNGTKSDPTQTFGSWCGIHEYLAVLLTRTLLGSN